MSEYITPSIRGIACHEAGHAVASASFGRAIDYVTIGPIAPGVAGRIAFIGPAANRDQEGVALWAGPMAQQLLCSWTASDRMSASDLYQIDRLADGDHGLIDAWREAATAFVLAHVAAIERVAAALMARTTLTEQQVKDAMM